MAISKLKKIADRVGRMDRAELRFRLRQELAKQQDGLLSFFRFDFARRIKTSGNMKRGNFFFGPADVNRRLEILRARLPEQAEGIVAQAEKILHHHFDLLGYADLNYGFPIEWNLDLIHEKRAPKKIFSHVQYLDFREVGDSKVTWELNRHQHFVTLAKAYRLTRDQRYPDELLRQWRHWWAENPYPVGINWSSSLEAGFRSLSWLWTYHLLEGAPNLPDFRNEWLRGLALHGRHIERYLSTYFSPNTHLLGEGVALFFLGVLCPELDAAESWKNVGWKIVLEEARRQVQEDGFHFEQSTYYHVYGLDFFLHAAVLASINGIPLPSEFERIIEKMLTALCLLGRVEPVPRFGDDDGGRLFDGRRNRGEHLLDPLATGAVLFNRKEFKAAAAHLREETIWLLGPEGVKIWDELEAEPGEKDSAALKTCGLYVLSSERPHAQLVVDCGPMGTQSGGHGHADALSLTLASRDTALLIDPGTCEYIGAERDLFRGTAMHNTLKIDGVDQAEAVTAFSWRRLTRAKAERWVQGNSFDLLVGSHDGYSRLPQPVTHRRWVVSLKNGAYLVRDCAEGSGTHRLELFWHVGPELQLVEEGVYRARKASNGLALLAAAGHGWAEEMRKLYWCPAYGQKAAASVAVFSTTAELPREFCALLVTLEEVSRAPGTFAQISHQSPDSRVACYRYEAEGEEHLFLFGRSGEAWQSGAVSSDAEFVCWSRWNGGAAQRIILVEGSFVKINNGASLACKGAVSWAEMTVDENKRSVFSSEPEKLEEEQVFSLLSGAEPGKSS